MAMCVSLESRHTFVTLILAVVDSLVVDWIPISVFIAFMAFCQLMLSLSRSPVRHIPSSLNGLVSREKQVAGSISGSLTAFPKRVYLVLITFPIPNIPFIHTLPL